MSRSTTSLLSAAAFVAFFAGCSNPAPTDTCGSGLCVATVGETCATCPTDCGSCSACGNGSCSGGETCASCPTDCGACAGCGDGTCATTETCSSCALDCGSCSTTCNSSTCPSGCCDGDSCVTGSSPGACGAGGMTCMVCETSFACTGGVCMIDGASRWNVVLESLTVGTTRYDGVAWDTIGGSPDPYVEVIVGSDTATPSGTSGVGADAYTVNFTGGPTATNVRASDMQAFLGFRVWDDDPTGDERIGYCSTSVTPAFSETTQTATCAVDAAGGQSGFTLTWHLERF